MVMALEGIRVLDLSRLAPGPYCTMILGDLGAEVIRVESLDPKARVEGVLGLSSELAEMIRAINPQGRNKKSIMLDLRKEEGKEVFLRLAKDVDVIVEEFRPGVTTRLGIDYEKVKAVNPGIIYCSITGYGQDGPYAHLPGHDINYISVAGALSVIVDKEGWPVVPSNLLADFAGGGMHAALSILAALVARFLHGVGQYVDCAMADGVASLMHVAPAMKDFLSSSPCYDVYETADGKMLSIGNVEPWLWANLCRALDREDLIPWQRDEEKKDELYSILKEIFKQKKRDEWFEYFMDKDVCVAPVNDLEDTTRDPQLLARDMYIRMPHEKFGEVSQVGISMKLSETPGRIRSLGSAPGEHTEELLKEAGYSEEEIASLRSDEVVA